LSSFEADLRSGHYPGENIMGIPVRIDDTLYEQAKARAKAEHPTIAGEIEFLAMIGGATLDNPDLPIDFIRDTLVVRQEGKKNLTPFVPEGNRS
jgi:ParD-like antitoxin of type II bacterial toxin-antitoxin system